MIAVHFYMILNLIAFDEFERILINMFLSVLRRQWVVKKPEITITTLQ